MIDAEDQTGDDQEGPGGDDNDSSQNDAGNVGAAPDGGASGSGDSGGSAQTDPGDIVNATDSPDVTDGAPQIVTGDGTAPAESYVPGVIEVQLKDHVLPQITGPTALNSSTADMGALNKLLEDLQVTAVEPSFAAASGGTDGATVASDTDPATPDGAPDLANFLTIRLPDGADVAAALTKLRAVDEIAYAVPLPTTVPATVTGDPLTGTSDQVAVDPKSGLENQWYLYRCGFDKAWSASDGSNTIIADIDFGFRLSHEDLTNISTSHAYNAYDGSTNVGQGSATFHGTGVLGLAGAAVNGKGIVGAAYSTELWPIQANTGGTALTGNSWANAIEWVSKQNTGGKRLVINLEVQTGALGNIEQTPSVNAAIKRAIARKVVVCVAAGNGNRDATLADDNTTPIPPTGSILVGATSYDATANARAFFSNFGSSVVICAPGDSNHDVTCSSTADNAYTNNFGGTSGATPKVSGAVALMLAVNQALTHDEVRDTLFAQGSSVTTDATKPVGNFLCADKAVIEAQRLAKA